MICAMLPASSTMLVKACSFSSCRISLMLKFLNMWCTIAGRHENCSCLCSSTSNFLFLKYPLSAWIREASMAHRSLFAKFPKIWSDSYALIELFLLFFCFSCVKISPVFDTSP